MIILELEQGTPEWLEARRCKVTGTDLDDIMGSPLSRVQLICEKIAEEATEQTKTFKSTPQMERGTAEEPFAVKAFEQRYSKKVSKIGFCVSDEFDWFGFSPDGLILDKAKKYSEAIEIKNPDTSTAMFYRATQLVGMETLGLGTWSRETKEKKAEFKPSSKAPFLGIPADYKWQVVSYFLVNTDLQKLSFLVYDARIIDEKQKLHVVEVFRDNELLIEAMKEAHEELVRFRSDWIKWKEIILPDNF